MPHVKSSKDNKSEEKIISEHLFLPVPMKYVVFFCQLVSLFRSKLEMRKLLLFAAALATVSTSPQFGFFNVSSFVFVFVLHSHLHAFKLC